MRLFKRSLRLKAADVSTFLLNELDAQLQDPDSGIRQMFARVARSEAKNYFATVTGNHIEAFERELAARAQRALDNLGSAAMPAEPLDRAVRRAVTRLESELCKVLYTLPDKAVCWNSACATQEPVPHMLDERDHRTIGEVVAEGHAIANAATLPGDAPMCICPVTDSGKYHMAGCPIHGLNLEAKEL